MLNISVVLYKTQDSDIKRIINSLISLKKLNRLYFVDNSPKKNLFLESNSNKKIVYKYIGDNLGYGKGHNIAINESIKSNITYHLVMNPDIYLSIKIFDKIFQYMDNNNEVGLLLPKTYYPNNEIQYNCRLLPSPYNLFSRFFLPIKFYNKLNDKYELKNTGYNKIINVPNLSGCFMFLRITTLKQVGLFDERFFMYFEDVDLTRRIHRKYKTIFYPQVKIIHRHERASYKNLKMTLIHIYNLILYFNRYGWIFDSERKKFNKKVLRNNNII